MRNKVLIMHTIDGDIESNQKMYEFEKRLSRKLFCRCHNSYLVNLDYVEGFQNGNVIIKARDHQMKMIPVSKNKKEEFMRSLARYVGRQVE